MIPTELSAAENICPGAPAPRFDSKKTQPPGLCLFAVTVL